MKRLFSLFLFGLVACNGEIGEQLTVVEPADEVVGEKTDLEVSSSISEGDTDEIEIEEEEAQDSMIAVARTGSCEPEENPLETFVCHKRIKNKDGSGGFVNNPANSRKKLKIIFPGKFTGNIKEVRAWTDDKKFSEKLTRATPNEYGNRERYYGQRSITKYKKPLTVGMLLCDGTTTCVRVPEPQKRLD